ncbi:MAG: SPOR domain-containing protein [Candidatus Cloacimonetes bacterium]|jgi:tetratricopeptide (TPR) repeat protein|nr:SPOR domain-containing protein [Candidatus Cloacimonadota bacterium]
MRKFCIILLLFGSISLFAQVGKDFSEIERQYKSGQLSQVKTGLATLKPRRDEEKALMGYYSALCKKTKTEALAEFHNVAEKYPKTRYGQLAMLEAAKIHILEREITLAQTLLRGINSADIIERFYWLAVSFYWLDDFPAAIANAENYLRLSPSEDLTESALHLVADSFMAQKKYQSAISSLAKVKKLPEQDLQYYYYRLGYAQELAGDYSQATKAYRAGYELDEYSQAAFDIEERLFGLRSRAPSLDLSFLYPYTPLELDLGDDPLQSTQETPQEVPEPVKPVDLTPSVTMPEITSSMPVKLLVKPKSGYFLQTGRFSVESNAERLVKSIRSMKIPATYYEEEIKQNRSWVVLAGPFENSKQTDSARAALSQSEINSFIVQY